MFSTNTTVACSSLVKRDDVAQPDQEHQQHRNAQQDVERNHPTGRAIVGRDCHADFSLGRIPLSCPPILLVRRARVDEHGVRAHRFVPRLPLRHHRVDVRRLGILGQVDPAKLAAGEPQPGLRLPHHAADRHRSARRSGSERCPVLPAVPACVRPRSGPDRIRCAAPGPSGPRTPGLRPSVRSSDSESGLSSRLSILSASSLSSIPIMSATSPTMAGATSLLSLSRTSLKSVGRSYPPRKMPPRSTTFSIVSRVLRRRNSMAKAVFTTGSVSWVAIAVARVGAPVSRSPSATTATDARRRCTTWAPLRTVPSTSSRKLL